MLKLIIFLLLEAPFIEAFIEGKGCQNFKL
jgi:hypothetical protein